MTLDDLQKIYQQAKVDRNGYTETIVRSDAAKKVVVAGPGTGKTTLFARLLSEKRGEKLTLSFINALVDELSLNLYGVSEVRTLHGFSAGILNRESGAKIYPKLSTVISQDAYILLNGIEINFDQMFSSYEINEEYLQFYKDRKKYYGNYYGFTDSIYAVAKLFEARRDKIPKYSQIVVDEFQDFNMSEVKLIELLAENSSVLLAGDDDQSLYIDLKNATPDFIREKFGAANREYEGFSLPFCSRSTRVIVEATNDVVNNAVQAGILRGRVPKTYRYFPSKEKDIESDTNPNIVYTQRFEGKMPHFIQSEITKIAKSERKEFSALVIVPSQMGGRLLPKFAKGLRKRGFRNIEYATRPTGRDTNLMEGLQILLEGKEDNLGYRIAAKHLLSNEDFDILLRQCIGADKVSDLIDKEKRKHIKHLLSTLKKIRDEKSVDDHELEEFLRAVGVDPYAAAAEAIRAELINNNLPQFAADRAIRQIPFTLTTITSLKGLSADYVFITHFDDPYFSEKGEITDKNVYAFLVALTRAKKKCYLISSKEKRPILLDWIDPSKVEQLDG